MFRLPTTPGFTRMLKATITSGSIRQTSCRLLPTVIPPSTVTDGLRRRPLRHGSTPCCLLVHRSGPTTGVEHVLTQSVRDGGYTFPMGRSTSTTTESPSINTPERYSPTITCARSAIRSCHLVPEVRAILVHHVPVVRATFVVLQLTGHPQPKVKIFSTTEMHLDVVKRPASIAVDQSSGTIDSTGSILVWAALPTVVMTTAMTVWRSLVSVAVVALAVVAMSLSTRKRLSVIDLVRTTAARTTVRRSGNWNVNVLGLTPTTAVAVGLPPRATTVTTCLGRVKTFRPGSGVPKRHLRQSVVPVAVRATSAQGER
jgi:hypothetical protein